MMAGMGVARIGLLFFRPLTQTYWRGLRAGFAAVLGAAGGLLRTIARQRCLPRRRRPDGDCCVHLPPSVYKRADPLIYAQYYLMAQGLAVTWDNPDIDLFDSSGAPVSGTVVGGRTYRVRVRVWNGSYDAPAVGLVVELSYLSFGAQTVSHAIGGVSVNLGAKGTAGCPVFADFEWVAPPEGGHRCLQARLIWSDDANPDNNLGQKNVMVAAAHSPATFAFKVRNVASVPRRFAFETDGYTLKPLPPCREQQDQRQAMTRHAESQARWRAAREAHCFGAFPLGDAWRVSFVPEQLSLEPGAEAEVAVVVEPLDPGFNGERPVNVHVFALDDRGERNLAGGVTLIVVCGKH